MSDTRQSRINHRESRQGPFVCFCSFPSFWTSGCLATLGDAIAAGHKHGPGNYRVNREQKFAHGGASGTVHICAHHFKVEERR